MNNVGPVSSGDASSGSNKAWYFVVAAVAIPTLVLTVLLLSGTELNQALLSGLVAYGVLPPLVILAYLLTNKDAPQAIKFRATMAVGGFFIVAVLALAPTVVLIALIASGTDFDKALFYGLMAFSVLPILLLLAYFLMNKVRMTAAIVAVTGVMVVVCGAVMLFALDSESVSAELNAGELRIEAPFVDESVPYQNIGEVEIRSGVDYGSRQSGYAGGNMLSGNYKNDEFGIYKLAIHRSTGECIVVHHSGGILVFNLDSSEETEQIYSDLLPRVPGNMT